MLHEGNSDQQSIQNSLQFLTNFKESLPTISFGEVVTDSSGQGNTYNFINVENNNQVVPIEEVESEGNLFSNSANKFLSLPVEAQILFLTVKRKRHTKKQIPQTL